jgi:hypothetical protein
MGKMSVKKKKRKKKKEKSDIPTLNTLVPSLIKALISNYFLD